MCIVLRPGATITGRRKVTVQCGNKCRSTCGTSFYGAASRKQVVWQWPSTRPCLCPTFLSCCGENCYTCYGTIQLPTDVQGALSHNRNNKKSWEKEHTGTLHNGSSMLLTGKHKWMASQKAEYVVVSGRVQSKQYKERKPWASKHQRHGRMHLQELT